MYERVSLKPRVYPNSKVDLKRGFRAMGKSYLMFFLRVLSSSSLGLTNMDLLSHTDFDCIAVGLR